MSVTTRVNERRLYSFLMAFLGFSMANNIAYVFSYGTTYFLIATVYAVLLFAFLMLKKKVDWKNIRQTMGTPFLLFIGYVVFSGLFAAITFMDEMSLLYRFFVGVISFCAYLTAMIDVICLFEYRLSFVKGLAAGIAINCFFCIAQYVFYQKNIPFTFLYDIFKQEHFHLSIYNFKAQGLFLEPSHMCQFLASVVPICVGMIGLKKIKNQLVLLTALICCALSGAGTSVAVPAGLLLFLLIAGKPRLRIDKSSMVLIYSIVTALLIVEIFSSKTIVSGFVSNVGGYLKDAFEGSNIQDAANAERLGSMKTAAALIPQNPLGCGWNMVHTLLQRETKLGTASAFSDILEMILEVGVPGVLLYVGSIFQCIGACLRSKRRDAAGIAIALICILVAQTMGDYAVSPCIMSILALGMCYRKQHPVHCMTGVKGDFGNEDRDSDLERLVFE